MTAALLAALGAEPVLAQAEDEVVRPCQTVVTHDPDEYEWVTGPYFVYSGGYFFGWARPFPAGSASGGGGEGLGGWSVEGELGGLGA